MSKAGEIKYIFRPLTLLANQRLRVHEVASFFMLVSNTGATKVKISIDDDPLCDCPVGYRYQERKDDSFFSHIDFQNPSGGPITIEYILSIGLVQSSEANITGTINVDFTSNVISSPVPLALNVGNSYQNTIAANTNRKELIIQNNGVNPFWWGESYANIDPATSRGNKIDVGEEKILSTMAAVFFESNSVDCVISLIELTKS